MSMNPCEEVFDLQKLFNVSFTYLIICSTNTYCVHTYVYFITSTRAEDKIDSLPILIALAV